MGCADGCLCASCIAAELLSALKAVLPIAERMQACCDGGDTYNYDNEFDAKDAVDYAKDIAVAEAAIAKAERK